MWRAGGLFRTRGLRTGDPVVSRRGGSYLDPPLESNYDSHEINLFPYCKRSSVMQTKLGCERIERVSALGGSWLCDSKLLHRQT